MPNAYQENELFFKQAYQSHEYHWAKTSCAIVEQYLDFIHSQRPVDSFLDIGCGEGANVRMAAQKGVFAVGLDRESLAVQNARQFAIQEGLNESAQFLHSDALILPFQPKSFDVVLDHGCLHHLRKGDWGKYQDNINFILKPNGYYILEVFSTEHKGYGKIPASRWHLKAGAYRRFFTEVDIKQFWGNEFDILYIQKKRGAIAGDWHALMQRKY